MPGMSDSERVVALIEELRRSAETDPEWARMDVETKVVGVIAPLLAQIRGIDLATADRSTKADLVAESKEIIKYI